MSVVTPRLTVERRLLREHEIVIACDPGLTCREAALKIGRSMDTVKKMRRRRA